MTKSVQLIFWIICSLPYFSLFGRKRQEMIFFPGISLVLYLNQSRVTVTENCKCKLQPLAAGKQKADCSHLDTKSKSIMFRILVFFFSDLQHYLN